jgi:hypothetical protein
LSPASARAPEGLQRTFAIYGGGQGPQGCVYTVVPGGRDTWIFKDREVVLNPPQGEGALRLVQCGDNPDYGARYSLTRPDGRTVDISQWFWYGMGTGSGLDYIFPPDSPTGVYTLTIRSRGNTLTQVFTVAEYASQAIKLREASGRPARYFHRGQEVLVDYQGFMPDTQIQVGLYRGGDNGGDSLDSWQVSIDQSGAARSERLRIPRDAPLGEYRLIACDEYYCSLCLADGRSSRIGWDLLYVPVTWRAFTITQIARVKLPSTGGGLNVYSRPGADMPKLGELAGDLQVTLLEGPERVQGAEWYRVRSDSANLEGWVHGGYLTIIA